MKFTGTLLIIVAWSCLASYIYATCLPSLPEHENIAKIRCPQKKHTVQCGSNTCRNRGQCIELPDHPFIHCDCQKGFYGKHCENHVCDIQPCINGTCQMMQPSPFFSCNCSEGFTGDLCQDVITTPSMLTTTGSLSKGYNNCDKFGAMGDIVERTQVSNNLTTCWSGSNSSPEAFVMEHCNVTSSFHSWKKGQQVMEACNGRAYLPSYTPVGIFQMGNYIDTLQGGTAGIFLGCLGDAGFKIAMQSCDSIPLIEHINGTFFTMNPNNYFAIV